jgi:hypothetical protein
LGAFNRYIVAYRYNYRANSAGEASMSYYRIYLLTPQDRICAFCDAECVSDHEAKEQALKALGSHPAAEIWQGSRIVGRVLACELDAISGMPEAHRTPTLASGWRLYSQ